MSRIAASAALFAIVLVAVSACGRKAPLKTPPPPEEIRMPAEAGQTG